MYAYTDTEDEIVQRLISKMPEGYIIKPLPEKQAEFSMALDKALIIVVFSDAQFDPPASTDVVKQTERVTVLLNIRSARLRGNFSIKEATQLIKLFLTGFQPADFGKLYLQKIEFESRDPEQNFFSYNITMVGTKLNVEIVEDEQLPLLKKITLINSGDFLNPDYSSEDYVTQHTIVEVVSTVP